tara:strand:+ start:731 stop:862 length:132 start_codon:yes stop_codon:yes gene_type:complete
VKLPLKICLKHVIGARHSKNCIAVARCKPSTNITIGIVNGKNK